MFVFCGCYNKLPETGCLNKRFISPSFRGQCSQVSIAELKSMCWLSHALIRSSRRVSVLAFSRFWCCCIPWLVATHSNPLLLLCFFSFSSFFILCLEACRMFCLSLVVWYFTIICSGGSIFICYPMAFLKIWRFASFSSRKLTEIVAIMLSPLQPSHPALSGLLFWTTTQILSFSIFSPPVPFSFISL